MTRLIAIAALAVASGVSAQDRECRYEADRAANINASASDQLELIARSGSLRVEGRSGLSAVRVRGRACASSEDLLDQLRLETGSRGGVVRVEVPEIDQGRFSWGRDRYAYLDLVLEVPEGMTAEIEDGSGETFLSGLGEIVLDDGSGELTLENIMGDVYIDDGSGEITMRGIDGDVTIDDGSGDIDIVDVTGAVSVEDGSGGIGIKGVGGNVRIDDGSGSISVADVRGDFTVTDDGSGSIRHSGVQGQVRIPEKRRR